jgi:hypothetical protein
MGVFASGGMMAKIRAENNAAEKISVALPASLIKYRVPDQVQGFGVQGSAREPAALSLFSPEP